MCVYSHVKPAETNGMGDEISMTSMPSCAKQMQAKGGVRLGEARRGEGLWEITLTNYPPTAS